MCACSGHQSRGCRPSCRLVMTVDGAMNANETKQQPRSAKSVASPSYIVRQTSAAAAAVSLPAERRPSIYELRRAVKNRASRVSDIRENGEMTEQYTLWHSVQLKVSYEISSIEIKYDGTIV